MTKPHLWAKVKSNPSAFAANANAPTHRASRKATAGDAGYGGSKKSDSKKMSY